MQRREFLKLSGDLMLAGAIAPWLSLPKAQAREESKNDHMFMMIRVWGGPDCVLSLNPWITARPNEKDLWLDENYEFKTSVRGTNIHLGPSAYSMEKFVQNLAVVNGVFMGATDLGHPSAQNYVTTAKGSPNVPHFISEMAEFFRLQKEDQTESILFNAELKTFDLHKLTRLPLQRLKQLAAEHARRDGSGGEFPDLSDGDNSVGRAQERLRQAKAARELFYAKFFEVVRIAERDPQALLNVESELVAAAAFASSQARFAQIDWTYLSPLDSHDNYPVEHQKSLRGVFERLARLLEAMSQVTHHASGLPLFPHHVTLCVVSEFGRLPYMNQARGKDHDFFDNSVLLGGRGIRGGTTIGAHHLFVRDQRRQLSQLSGCHIDYKTGQVVKNDYYNSGDVNALNENPDVSLIRPENVLATLTDLFGVERSAMRLLDPHTPRLPGLLI